MTAAADETFEYGYESSYGQGFAALGPLGIVHLTLQQQV